MSGVISKLSLALGAAVILVSGLVLAADIPADKATIKIDVIEGTKGAVELPHAKHVKELKKKGGGAIACKDCHHTLKSDSETPKPCTECHVKMGEAEKDVGGKKAPALAQDKGGKPDQKSILFHLQCKDGCHKDMKDDGKKITACKTCHAKE